MLTSSFVKDLFTAGVRHFATFGGGWLLAHGVISGGQVNGWLGSVCFLGGVAWSAWDKYQRHGIALGAAKA